MSVQPTLTPSGAISLQNEPFSEVLGFLFVLALLYGGLMFAVGFGIRQGRINAFRWGIVCSALLLIAGAGWSILAICVIVYCCLRLLNRITGAAH